jgi:hypothetical protein
MNSSSTTERVAKGSWDCVLVIIVCLVLSSLPAKGTAGLIGQWTFEGGSTADSTGHFGALQLFGTAAIVDGELIVSRSNVPQVPLGWAKTDGSYSGPTITSKTLVSWVTLTSLSDGQDFGSAMTLDAVTSDVFDGIVFGEQQQNRWMAGSDNLLRTQDFNPGFEETSVGTRIQMAYTYEVVGQNVTITGYRDGVLIGQYSSANAASWGENDAEIIFGARHFVSTYPLGALDARIAEARLYDSVLTQAEVAALEPLAIPEIDPAGTGSVLTLVAGVLGLLERRRLRAKAA